METNLGSVPEPKLCRECGEPFELSRPWVGWQKYCGRPCKMKAYHKRREAKALRLAAEKLERGDGDV